MAVHWCTDGLSEEERAAWHKEIVKTKSDVDFWEDDLAKVRTNLQFIEEDKSLMSQQEYEADKAEYKGKETLSLRNYNTSKRYLEILERDGPSANIPGANSTAGTTRSISEVDGSNVQDSSKRR